MLSRLTFIVIGVYVSFSATAHAQFLRVDVPVANDFGAVVYFDYTGNGTKDLVIISTDLTESKPRYFYNVYTLNNYNFVRVGSINRPLPDKLAIVSAGVVRDEPSLIMITEDDLQVWAWEDERFIPRYSLAIDSVFSRGEGRLIEYSNWVADLDYDGNAEILVPQKHSVAVVGFVNQSVSKMSVLYKLDLHTEQLKTPRILRNIISSQMPIYSLRQIDGKSWVDLISFNNGIEQIFWLGEKPYNTYQANFTHNFKPRKPIEEEISEPRPMHLVAAEDLNDDDYIDTVVWKIESDNESELQVESSINVYYGKPGNKDENRLPDQIYRVEDFALPLVMDLNSDGLQDLVIVQIEVGVWQALRALLSRTVKADVAFYYMDGETRRYTQEPIDIDDYSIRFSFGFASHQPLAKFGHFNSDRFIDLALSVDDEELGIHWGRDNEAWNDDPDYIVEGPLPLFDDMVSLADIDNNGTEDIILKFERRDIFKVPAMRYKLAVLFSGEQFTPPEE